MTSLIRFFSFSIVCFMLTSCATPPPKGVVRLNRTRLRKSRNSRILTSIKPTPLGKSGFALLLKIVSTVEVTFLIKVVIN